MLGSGSLGNGHGLVIDSGAHDNLIGGSSPNSGNVIAHNSRRGVAIGGVGTGNRVSRNSIFDNVDPSFNDYLGSFGESGVTTNEPLDTDMGPKACRTSRCSQTWCRREPALWLVVR